MSERPRRRWQPYPAYRDSGVEWLGEIPEHWEVKRLRFAAHINPPKSEIAHFPDDFEVSFLPMESIGNDATLVLDETRTLEQVRQGYTYFRDQDVIVAKITPCFENGKGALCHNLTSGIGFGTTELHVLRPHINVDPKFLFYVTFSVSFRKLGTATMYGAAGQKRIDDDFVKDFPSGFPPLEEQHTIAAFLDRETAKLDALIAAKQRLIERLQEQRAALISHAVTKGLDPSVPMRDSGIAWLGEIPAHWELLPLRRIITKFVDYRGKTPEKVDEGVSLITARNIRNGILDFSESQEFIREEDYADWMVRGFPETGDVLVTMEAPLGATAQIEKTYVALAQRLILLKADFDYITNDFLKHYFLSTAGQGELWSRATGSTAIGIKASHLREILVPIPPVNEQEEINHYIVEKTSYIEAPIRSIEQVMERLQEYRTALISAAVTGKIDVRGEVDP